MPGNLPRALALHVQAHEQLVAMGLEDSDFNLDVLDIQAVIHDKKSDYIEARKFCKLVASKTSANRSPFFHPNCLVTVADLDIIVGASESESRSHL